MVCKTKIAPVENFINYETYVNKSSGKNVHNEAVVTQIATRRNTISRVLGKIPVSKSRTLSTSDDKVSQVYSNSRDSFHGSNSSRRVRKKMNHCIFLLVYTRKASCSVFFFYYYSSNESKTWTSIELKEISRRISDKTKIFIFDCKKIKIH